MKNLFVLLFLSLSMVSVHAAEETTLTTTSAPLPMLYDSAPLLDATPVSMAVTTDVPLMCTMDYTPVCGIDKVTYGNACGAGKTKIAYKGECSTYIDTAVYAKLETKITTLKKQLAKYSDAKLIAVLGTIDQRIEMVKLSRIAREMQVERITLYTFVKNTIPAVLAERTPVIHTGKRPGIENISYTIDGSMVTLKDGKAETATESGSASKNITKLFGDSAIGDINADGKVDVVLLLTQETGGSGVFYYVAAALMTENGYVTTNAVFLGDRIAPQTTEVNNGQIIVNYADRKTSETMTIMPSVGVSKYLKMVDGKLVEGKK